MCGHNWYTIEDQGVKVKYCVACGLTRLENGRLLFDKGLIKYIKKMQKKEAKTYAK